MQTTKPRAQSRTWRTHNTAEVDRIVIYATQHTVTLTRTPGGLIATVDGESADLTRAVSLLQRAWKVELLAETLEPAPIGKVRAASLHRLMGRLGLPHAQHYALAAAALGEWTPIPSLAELTDQEARTVLDHLNRLYPSARTLAA